MRRALAILGLLIASPACAEALFASLSTPRVAITSTFTGSSVVVFGAIERDGQTVARAGPYDIVITVRGPRQSLVVREKEPLGPMWINRSQQKFVDVPLFLGVLSSRPLREVTTEPLRRRLRVGLRAIMDAPDFTLERGPQGDPFRDALLRLRVQEGLYVERERGVSFLTPTIFRGPVPLPATAPTGFYDVDVALFADGVVLARAETIFELAKIGFEQRMAEFAREWSLAYGVATTLIALSFGWLASVIFRRD